MALLRQLAKAVPSSVRWNVNPTAALFSRGLKDHTGIAGLDVDPNARDNLKMYLEQVLQAIKVIPEEAEYRRNVETTINHKLSIVNSDITDEEAEDQLEAQLEQYIKFTKDELSLIPKMAGKPVTYCSLRLTLLLSLHNRPIIGHLLQSGNHGMCHLVTRYVHDNVHDLQ